MTLADPDKCSGCRKQIKETQGALFCCTCNDWFHNLCVQVPKEDLVKYQKLPWVCKTCQQRKVLDTAVRLPKSLSASQNPNDSHRRKNSLSDVCGNNCQAKFSNLERRFSSLEARLSKLEKTDKTPSQNLHAELQKLRADFSTLSKTSGNPQCEIIISNVPEVKKEDTVKMAECVLEALDPELPKDSVIKATRFTAKNGPRYIKVEVASSRLKEALVIASKKKKLALKDLSLSSKVKSVSRVSPPEWLDPLATGKLLENGRVFLNVSVSRHTRSLFLAALKLKINGSILTAWTWRNEVYYKTSPDGNPIRCSSIEQLSSMAPVSKEGVEDPSPPQ